MAHFRKNSHFFVITRYQKYREKNIFLDAYTTDDIKYEWDTGN